MIRMLLYMLLGIAAIAVMRGVIGIVMKAASAWLAQGDAREEVPPGEPGSFPSAGVLRKDPICGTYVSEAISLKVKTPDGIVHFCSPACRDRYASSVEV